METIWVLTANAGRARLFANVDNRRRFQLIREFDHPASRKKDQELVTDRDGRYRSMGDKLNAFEAPTEPKEVEAARFAEELAQVLDYGRTTNQYERLIVAASPHFLGLLKTNLDPQVQRRVSRTIDKDFTGVDADQLPQKLEDIGAF